jgi:UDP-N-acetylenolpyruvoylglucosamine reductase
MTIIDPADSLENLRTLCGGAVALPGDEGFDAARSGFNLALDQRPAAVAYPADAAEVAAIVRYARGNGLRVAAQGTGHNAGPLGDLRDTVLMKTSGLQGVEVDPVARRARVGAGVRWEAVMDAAAPHGLYPLHGSSPTVGVVGYSLGGGMGWLARSHGLQTNSVTAIELVTGEGEFVRTDAKHDPELFWALRGGGGNFGVVTAIEFKLYPLREAYAGMLIWDWTHAERVLTAWNEWTKTAPDNVTTSLRIMQMPPIPEVPEPIRGRQLVMIDGAVTGEDPEAVIAPLRALEPEMDTFATVPASALTRIHQDPEDPVPYVSESALVEELPAAAIEAIVKLAGPGSGSPLLLLELRQLGGAVGRIAPGHGALPRLEGQFVLFMLGMAMTPEMAAAAVEHAEGVKETLQPFLGTGHYLNFAEYKVDPAASYGAFTYRRLRVTKRRVDPDNVIRANHEIPPVE